MTIVKLVLLRASGSFHEGWDLTLFFGDKYTTSNRSVES
jgi:hypothetical protein